jgi:maternal-effect protein exuperantia
MPYDKLPLNVIRNYNLRIVDTGRYRMLKEIRNNRMLKSKSEVAACNDFASWLIKLQKDNFTDKKIVSSSLNHATPRSFSSSWYIAI